jgi:hypothetical protein
VEEGGFPSHRHGRICIVQHTGEAVNNTPKSNWSHRVAIHLLLATTKAPTQPARFGDPTGDRIAGQIPAHQPTGRRPSLFSHLLVDRQRPGFSRSVITQAQGIAPQLRLGSCPRLDAFLLLLRISHFVQSSRRALYFASSLFSF